jgi:hypothetical protein
MPFTLGELVVLRPFAYHVCGSVNFASIKASRSLRSARSLLSGTEYEQHLRGRRSKAVRVAIDGRDVEIRDHRPLAPGSLSLPEHYTIDDFVDELNARVFLWAGTATRPVDSGRNHIARYASEGNVFILRVPLAALLRDNATQELQVTFCNSGAARHHDGLPARRGPDTFVSPSLAARRRAEVVELTFRGDVTLPPETLYADSLAGPWLSLTA